METSIQTGLIFSGEDQDKIFANAFSVLRQAIEEHAFPAASVAVTLAGRLIALKTFGSFVYRSASDQEIPENRSVEPETLFDLASVTKVVATTFMAMILYERGILDLEAPVCGVVPEFISVPRKDARRDNVTFHMLLAHSSGLPAYEKLFLKASTREELLEAAFSVPLSTEPGTHAQYSDIGFIILGVALERLANEPLDAFCQREIFGPLGMAHTTFRPMPAIHAQIPPTAQDQGFRHKIIQGEVQDENAYVLGGVAGHAGLFANAHDLARLACATLREEGCVVRPETVAFFTHREATPAGTSRALGWDTPSTPSQSGKFLGPRSYGHLGYTGTSLWVDPDRRLSVTLLTNRTWPDCQNQAIKLVRPKFHDAIVEACESTMALQ